jgi:hypothetical protein
MPTPELHVRVGRVPHESHALVAMLYAGDDCVSHTVNFRDMRQVRSYYNGVLAGLTLTNAVRYGDTITLDRIGSWPYKRVQAVVPINPEYCVADGIDLMLD